MSDKNVESKKRQVPVIEGLFYLPASPSEKPYLIGSKCNLCGHISFPKRVVCPICVKGDTMQEVPLSRYGKVKSFSISRISQPGFPAPYVQSFVQLDEGPEIFSIITGVDPDKDALQIGTQVELVIEKISEDEKGNHILVYKFATLKGE
jgi:uncharacterized OB-fold protein